MLDWIIRASYIDPRTVMGNVKEKVDSYSCSEQLETTRCWREALEGSNKEMAYEIMNLVLDGKITRDAALALLNKIHD